MCSTAPQARASGEPVAAPRVVVMGVSGCGKSTVGQALAERLGVHFVEGDVLHSERNVAKMAAGVPLTDADRHGWLQSVAEQISNPTAQALGVVATCSALKRRYRDQLRAEAPDLRFVYLHGPPDLLAQRMADRPHHYMPASLLQSQLDTLEPPQADEGAIALDISQPPERLVEAALRALS
jgi:gluconokinase